MSQEEDLKNQPAAVTSEETLKNRQEPYSCCDEISTKRWSFPLTRKKYAELLIRLKYDGLKRNELGVGLLELYLDNDEDFIRCLEKIQDRFQKKTRRSTRSRYHASYSLKKEKKNLNLFEGVDGVHTISPEDMPQDLLSFEEERVNAEEQKRIERMKKYYERKKKEN